MHSQHTVRALKEGQWLNFHPSLVQDSEWSLPSSWRSSESLDLVWTAIATGSIREQQMVDCTGDA